MPREEVYFLEEKFVKKLFSLMFVMVLITGMTALVGCNGLWDFDDDDDVANTPISFTIPASIGVASISAPLRPAVVAGTNADYSAFEAMVYLRNTNPALDDTFVASLPINVDGTFTLTFQGYAGEYYVKVASPPVLLYKYLGALNSANAATTTVQILDEESTAVGLIVQNAKTAGTFVDTTTITTAEINAVATSIEAALAAGTSVANVVTGVQLNKTTTSIVVGQTETLTATTTPTGNTVTWASSNTGVATVANGVVTAVATGNTNITATTANGLVATCVVTVTPIRVSSVSVAPTTLSLTVGNTSQLTATVLPGDAANKSVTWSTSNSAVATVSNTGLVTAAGAGNATITVTTVDGGKTSTCAVGVVAVPVLATGVTMTPTTLALTVGGSSSTLAATVAPPGATNTDLTWSVLPATGIVNVTQAGVVSPVAAGVATVTVTTVDGGFTATCLVTVTAAPKQTVELKAEVSGVTLADLFVKIENVADGYLATATLSLDAAVAGVTTREIYKKASLSTTYGALCLAAQGYTLGDGLTGYVPFSSITFTTAIPGDARVSVWQLKGSNPPVMLTEEK